MKKKRYLLSAVALVIVVGLMITACAGSGDTQGMSSEETQDTPSSGTDETAPPEETQPPAETQPPLPTSQEYVTASGAYKLTMLDGLVQTDISPQTGTDIMKLAGEADRSGFSCVLVGGSKTNVIGNPSGIGRLEEYADHISNLVFYNYGASIQWEDMKSVPSIGFKRGLTREGTVQDGMDKTQIYGYYVESTENFLSVLIMGKEDDIKDAKQTMSLEVLDKTAGQCETISFINSMTAVLDALNGLSLRDTYKVLEEMGADEYQLAFYVESAKQGLLINWNVETPEALMETADMLINEGDNEEALSFLTKLRANKIKNRSSFEQLLRKQDIEEEIYIYLMAAYDANAEYGKGAIAAWDLSRVGTLMGFGYVAGYCTYEEAMDKTLEAAQKAQSLYGSWEDFNKSYLYGYSYWAEESLEDSTSSAGERAALVERMQSKKYTHFTVDWNTELKKEW